MNGRIKRKNITIKLLDLLECEQYTWRWIFSRACPVKWTGPDFEAGTAEVAFESIELVHLGLEPGDQNGRGRQIMVAGPYRLPASRPSRLARHEISHCHRQLVRQRLGWLWSGFAPQCS